MGNRLEQALIVYESQDPETRDLKHRAREAGQEYGNLTEGQIVKLEEFDRLISQPSIISDFDRTQQALLVQPANIEEQ